MCSRLNISNIQSICLNQFFFLQFLLNTFFLAFLTSALIFINTSFFLSYNICPGFPVSDFTTAPSIGLQVSRNSIKNSLSNSSFATNPSSPNCCNRSSPGSIKESSRSSSFPILQIQTLLLCHLKIIFFSLEEFERLICGIWQEFEFIFWVWEMHACCM
jgi:hypothetical protein